MDRNKLFKNTAYLLISLFIVNLVAVKLYWYYSIWYFDMITHFWGGLCLGLAFIWLFSFQNSSSRISLKLAIKIILGVLLIGVIWEIYEVLVNNVFAQNPFNTLDTISDIFFDLSGGICAILYIWKKMQKKQLE